MKPGKLASRCSWLRRLALLATFAMFAHSPWTFAVQISMYNQYKELVDLGNVYVTVSSSYDPVRAADQQVRMICSNNVTPTFIREGYRISITALAVLDTLGSNCSETINVGPLPAGDYNVELDFIGLGSGAIYQSGNASFHVEVAGGKCNPNPSVNSVQALPKGGKTADQIATRLAQDSTYRMLFGSPTNVSVAYPFLYLVYPPLENRIVLADKVNKTGDFQQVWLPGNDGLCFITPPPDTTADMIEFYNINLGHYFYTGYPEEATAIDAGAAGPGWSRTGLSFRVVTNPGCPQLDPGIHQLAYRFYGRPGVGPNSHFYTLSRDECYAVSQDPGWKYEAAPFWAWRPAGSTCPQDTRPLYRAYNQRAAQNDSNHRYSTDAAVIEGMTKQGWANEGLVMCL